MAVLPAEAQKSELVKSKLVLPSPFSSEISPIALMFEFFLLKFSLSSSIVSVVAISPTGKYPVLSPSVILYPVFIKFVVAPSNSSPLYALSLFSENIFFKLS